MLRLGVQSVHSHVDTLLSFMFVSFWFFPHCLPFSRLFFLFWGEFEKSALTFVACPRTYIHSHSHTREWGTLTPLTYGIIMRTRVSWEIRRKKSYSSHRYGTHAHTLTDYVDSDVHCSLSRTSSSLHAWHVCAVVQKRQRIKIKYTGSCSLPRTQTHARTHTLSHSPSRSFRHKTFCMYVSSVWSPW